MILEVPGVGRADHCQVSTMKRHYPHPVRFVWHHMQPQEAGGQTVPDNLIQLCDSCHYTIHRILWCMANILPIPKAHPDQYAFANEGYKRCVVAGTVKQIPNEG